MESHAKNNPVNTEVNLEWDKNIYFLGVYLVFFLIFLR